MKESPVHSRAFLFLLFRKHSGDDASGFLSLQLSLNQLLFAMHDAKDFKLFCGKILRRWGETEAAIIVEQDSVLDPMAVFFNGPVEFAVVTFVTEIGILIDRALSAGHRIDFQ